MSVNKNIKKQYNAVKTAQISFDYDNKTLRLPVNPESFEVASVMKTETYDILGLGMVVIPAGLEPREFSFETEIPYSQHHYVEVKKDFKNVDEYESFFQKARRKRKVIGFQYDNGVSKEISTKVYIVDFNYVENAGEEGDKQYSFRLIEALEYGPRLIEPPDKKSGKSGKNGKKDKKQKKKVVEKKKNTSKKKNSKKPKTYIVKKGDNLYCLAKRFYGKGSFYTKIYNANRSVIKNPALIYPNMKLTIPE